MRIKRFVFHTNFVGSFFKSQMGVIVIVNENAKKAKSETKVWIFSGNPNHDYTAWLIALVEK
jgi:hypothetical protein